LGISSSSLRRWARRKKRDGTSRVLGAHFIRRRWVLLGKLTPKRVESIRSGLNLHEHRQAAPKKWKWKSKEERLAILDQQIKKAAKDYDDLPGTQGGWEASPSRFDTSSPFVDMSDGLVRKEMKRIGDKWTKLYLRIEKLTLGKNLDRICPPHITFREQIKFSQEIAEMTEENYPEE